MTPLLQPNFQYLLEAGYDSVRGYALTNTSDGTLQLEFPSRKGCGTTINLTVSPSNDIAFDDEDDDYRYDGYHYDDYHYDDYERPTRPAIQPRESSSESSLGWLLGGAAVLGGLALGVAALSQLGEDDTDERERKRGSDW